MPIVPSQNPLTTLFAPPGGFSSLLSLRTSLIGLWCPNQHPRGKILRNLAQRRFDVAHGGTLRNTAGGLSAYAVADASFGSTLFPLAAQPRPFSVFVRVVPSDAINTTFLFHGNASEPTRVWLNLLSTGQPSFYRYGEKTSPVAVPLGRPTSFGFSETPSGLIVAYHDGIPYASAAAGTGYAINVNTSLSAVGSCDLLLLAIWVGRALAGQDFRTLHNDPSALFAPPEQLPISTTIVVPPIAEGRPRSVHDMPNRPVYRRWWYRKKVGEFG